MKINYAALKIGDVVHTTSSGPVSRIIRRVTGGGPSSHCGFVACWAGQFFVCEMRPKSLFQKGGVTLTPFGMYTDEKRAHVVGIMRNYMLSTPEIGSLLNADMAADYRKTIEYDLDGVMSFVIKRVKQRKDRVYCSEYVAWRIAERGVPLPAPLLHAVSPNQLYRLTDIFTPVPDWRAK